MFFSEYKSKLVSEKISSLDKYIQHHCERKMKNQLNLSQALEELQLLVQEKLTDSQSPREIVDFSYSISKMAEADHFLKKEMISILYKLQNAELKWFFTLEKYFKRTESDIPEALRPSSLPVTGAFLKQRIFCLTNSENQILFDEKGNIKRHASLTGRSLVTRFPEKNPEFYLKKYPELPGYEFASILFMRMLGINHLPFQDLIIVDSKYPVLLTQAVDGDPVYKIWSNPETFNTLDPFHTHLLIISALLLNPEDGKEDNFILSPDKKYLIPIDNDHCFLPSTFQKGKFWSIVVNTALQTKTLLFCLDEMNKPIPIEVRKHILSLDFDVLLTSWMRQLVKVDDRYHHLVDEKQRDAFFKNGTVLRIPFYLQFIHNLYWKVNKIQDLLRSLSEQTPFSLLKAVEPFAARCYEGSFQAGETLEKRFKAATDQLYIDTMRGSRMSILNTKIMMDIINVPIKKGLVDGGAYYEVRPSDALEVLEKSIKIQKHTRKLEQDLLCEFDEKKEEGIWTTLFGDPILEADLKNFFKNPKEGLVLKGSKLITNTNLANLFGRTPEQGTMIKFLSLANSPLLDSRAVRVLVEGCPNLESLNISGCVKLEEIVTTKGGWSFLARLEARECLNLKKVISSSPIKVLRVGTHQKIEIFVEKHILDIFTISTQTDQFDFSLKKGDNFVIKPLGKDSSLDSFFLSAVLEKDVFERYFNSPKITIGTHSILLPQDLQIFITSLDLRTKEMNYEAFKKMVHLELINLKSLQLPKFNALGISIVEDLLQAHWPKLTQLNLSDHEITYEGLVILSREKWPLLETLTLGNAKITTKKLLNFALSPSWPNLKNIKFYGIGLPYSPNLLLPNNGHQLKSLDLSSTKITASEIEAIVNLSKWPNLKHFNLSNNPLRNEGLAILSQGSWLLEGLNIENTQVTSAIMKTIVDTDKWQNLKNLNLSDNEIADEGLAILSQGNWPLLQVLNLERVLITSVGIEAIVKEFKWANLTHLNLAGNKITDDGLVILSHRNWLQLEVLNLRSTCITNKGLLYLYMNVKWLEFPGIKNIRWPKFKRIYPPSCIDTHLASSLHQEKFSQVERLELNNLKMTIVEIVLIAQKYKFHGLKNLNISNNEIFDEGLSVLTKANWPLLEELNVANTNMTLNGVEVIVNQSKWQQLKSFNISNNEIFDEGLSALTQADWPLLEELNVANTKMTLKGVQSIVNQSKWQKLKSFNISNNEIFDEGLKTLTFGEWPFFERLVYSHTKVTLEGHIIFLENLQWPNLSHLEHSLSESFYNYNEDPVKWSLPEIILATAPIYHQKEFISVTVLDMTWLDSKEIYLSIHHNGAKEKILILPRDKLKQLESMKLSLRSSLIQSGRWPSNLKTLDLSNSSLSRERRLENLFFIKYPHVEDLNFNKIDITQKDLDTLIRNSYWPSLKKFCISHAGIEAKGIESLVNALGWSNLKVLDISNNPIGNDGLEVLSSGNWPFLENLNLQSTSLREAGVESIVKPKWPNLKTLDVSYNLISDIGLKILSSGRWQLLESLNLKKTNIGARAIENMVCCSYWPKLKTLDISDNSLSDQELKTLISKKWCGLEDLNFKTSNP